MSVELDLLIRSSIVLVLGLCATRLLRPQPAAMRHWVVAAAIMFGAAQPALRLAVPEWQVPTRQQVGLAVEGSPTFVAATDESLAWIPDRIEPASGKAAWLTVARVWAAGTVAIVMVMILGIAWLMWQSMRSVPAGDRWRREHDLIATAFGCAKQVRIAETRHPALLVTWGIFRPVILLPKGASVWPEDRIRLVLAHEMAHVVRRDWLLQLAAELSRAFYWPNPLFWIACARLRMESEQACDDAVLALGTPNTSYAEHLVELARRFRVHGRTWLPAPSMARPSTLERRIVAMLNTTINRRPVSGARKTLAAALLLFMAAAVAAASARAAAPSGVLKDPSGRVLPGANVRLSAIGADATHETQSDSSGAFQFGEVPDGDYLLSVRLPGFRTTRQRVRVTNNMAPIEATIQVGTLRETITVTPGYTASGPVTSARPAPAAPKCGSTTLGGNLKPPMKLKDVRPRYRQEWADAGLSGEVLLQATIGIDGRVTNVEPVSPGNADLEDEAIAAVSQWEFSPTYLNCGTIEVRMFVSVTFKADR